MEEKEKKTKIAMCIPTYNSVTAKWLIGFMAFIMRNSEKYELTFHITEGQPVSRVREDITLSALAVNPDYILFLDSDNLIPDKAIDKLLDSMTKSGADIMSGLYFTKDPPYYPVIREFRSDGFWILDNVPLGQIIEIAGCGLGACLIKPAVFRAIERPYFKFNYETWGKKQIMMSEDLYFCRAAMKKGFKLFVDTSCISTHIGGDVELNQYLSFAPIRQSTKEDREELYQDIVEFTGRTKEEVDFDIMVGPELMRQEWTQANPKTPEEEKKFYKETKNYLYDLAAWHFSTRRTFDVEMVEAIRQKTNTTPELAGGSPKILDFGTGFGQNA